MHDPLTGSIGALQGASTFEVQGILASFAGKRLKAGLRVAGVVEIAEPSSEGACGPLALREIGTGAMFPIMQDLGSSSTACRLDSAGLAAACGAVLQTIEQGVDVVILSKFGKLEASGGGLLDCFAAAAVAGVPCITGVAPALSQPFLDFAGEYLQWLDASEDALESWWAARVRLTGAKASEALMPVNPL
jgi:hypothetical protein